MTPRRVAVTGLGVLAPGGIGAKDFWSLLAEGRTATRRITLFDPSPYRSQVAAEADFDPGLHGLSPRQARRLDRAAQFALVAVREAVRDSGVEPSAADPHRVGVCVGTAVGCATNLEAAYHAVSDGGRVHLVDHSRTTPELYDHFVPSSIAAEVAWAVGAEGPATVVSTGCTSGIDAVGHACELIREGSADVVVAAGTEAPISPTVLASFDTVKATTPHSGDPGEAARPFDRTRDGFVLGEGSAALVLEDLEHARRRGAQIHAEIAGYANRCNAFHMTGLRADGLEMARAINASLDEARLNPQDVDYVNAHGSGTVQNDVHETEAFKATLGEHARVTPVSSIKSMVGHSLGAIGTIEIAASILAMAHHVVPPTANLRSPDPACDLDYVPLVAREWRTDTVLTVGSGFGGFQSAMVLTRPERRTR
ncbi:beta-ketoacyl-[acyl-carrier-protein] synthase family protein [Streptomyces sp. NPDC005017]|uniref:beta-ketoacyl-[acyl-carrier-protein] synthase family protein n=1 Tax=Streptomyces sp. NPDC005017 TaxID=3364706 RepID=UPI003694F283